jgi:hypothetical protein
MPTFGRNKVTERVFLVVFSILILAFFYILLSSNGLVLGNDPAVHLERAIMFLSIGKIPLGDIAWYPPLFHILLSAFMAFTGATSVDQMLVLMKSVTALIDWLLVFSVYLLGAKFFSKRVGVLAAALLLLCFPLYEINFWGGYTSILSLAFLSLLFVYISLERKGFGNAFLIFVFAFSLVLSHQLATFMAFVILPPFIVVMLVKSRGRYSKAWIAGLLGGLIAFFIYYFQAIAPHLGSLITIVFFQLKMMLYQVSAVNETAFIVNFGVILVFAFSGIVIAFFQLKKKKKLSFFLLLILALFVPLFFSQSYLFGLYLPYQWFIYYMLAPLAVLAAVSFSVTIDFASAAYLTNKKGWRRLLLKTLAIITVILVFLVLILRFQAVIGRIDESTAFYSTTDIDGYNAALWLKQSYREMTRVVVSEKPGEWFGVYSGKYVVAETNPIVDWNVVAESVLDLSYDIEHPITMVRAYESKGNISAENYISVNGVWTPVSYLSEDTSYVSFREGNGTLETFALSVLNKEIVLENESYPKGIEINYFNEKFALTENILVQNDSYPANITWTMTSLKSDLYYVVLYLSYHFDLSFSFSGAYIPGVLNWENPWDRPSKVQDNQWAVTDFSGKDLTDKYIGIYDDKDQAEFALKFLDKPDSGSLGALSNHQIDAFRFQYQFYQLNANQTVSSSYQILTFSQTSFPETQPPYELVGMFNSNSTKAFDVKCRDYASFVKEQDIGFSVYDVQRFDPSLLRSKVLQVLYSNNEFVVCKIKSRQ